jgi:hypothetical protein
VRCEACNKIFSGKDWKINKHTKDFDSLCHKCRDIVFAVVHNLEEDELNDDTDTD